MAKKSRRARAKQRARAEKIAQERRPQQPVPASTEVRAPAAAKAQVTRVQGSRTQGVKTQDLATRYQYVIPEVRRIGIIAGAIVIVLIILSFVLS
jgi:hypothetical protein